LSEAQTIHGGCVLVGEAGMLIRGASGSGKSTLAREVVSLALRGGRFGRLVSDDRTRLEAHHGRLLARSVEPLGGSIEVFGLGIVRQSFERAAVIRLVVDLSDVPPRYPEQDDRHVVLCGVMIPRIRMQAGAISADVALGCLSGVCDTVVTL
jgi:serine kinase of HPr protein (carbohydrate metabolism regulator)